MRRAQGTLDVRVPMWHGSRGGQEEAGGGKYTLGGETRGGVVGGAAFGGTPPRSNIARAFITADPAAFGGTPPRSNIARAFITADPAVAVAPAACNCGAMAPCARGCGGAVCA
jgi:hypothetical protein